MTIEASTAIALLATIISAFATIWLATARVAAGNYQKDLDRRLDKIELRAEKDATKHEATDGRLHQAEKDTIRQDGEIRLVQSSHDNLEHDVAEIKRNMCTKQDLAGLGRELGALITGKRNPSGQHTFGGPGIYAGSQQGGISESPAAPRPRPPSRPGSSPDHNR